MRFTVTISATANPLVAMVVREWLKVNRESLRALVQERAPAGITITKVDVHEETP